MNNLNYSLLSKDQKTASDLVQKLFNCFERIDVAAKDINRSTTEDRLCQAVRDFDSFFSYDASI